MGRGVGKTAQFVNGLEQDGVGAVGRSGPVPQGGRKPEGQRGERPRRHTEKDRGRYKGPLQQDTEEAQQKYGGTAGDRVAPAPFQNSAR